MKKYNLYWNSAYKYYYYSDDLNTNPPETYEKSKKNKPINKFNRWLDKFVSLQNEDFDEFILELLVSKFDNINNIHPNTIKHIFKIYKLNKYYKLIPNIYCRLLGRRFHINEELKTNIKKVYCKFINNSHANTNINYYFFIKAVLNHFNEHEMARSIPCINSLDKNYEYIIYWNKIKNII
jgi:hypothetical protein